MLQKLHKLKTNTSIVIVFLMLLILFFLTVIFFITWGLFIIKVLNLDYFKNVGIDSFTLFSAGILLTYILDNLTKLILRDN